MRVATIPAAHPYVAGLGLDAVGVEVLADPPVLGAAPGQWWPPVMLDPGWIDVHADDFDLVHLHFGAESLSLARLEAVLAALRAAGRPLVHTVHDLTHPQLGDSQPHVAQLDRIIPAADGLITLTPGAAADIAARWGRAATVIAHPAMRRGHPFPQGEAVAPCASPSGSPSAAPVVGVHLRDLRPGIDGPGTVALLVGALAALGARDRTVLGRVWMRDRVRDRAAAAEVRRRCAAAGLPLTEASRVSDTTLEAQLAGLAVSLLPYRHGTHSGWLELCWDLGVPVAAPAIGHLAEQHPDPAFCAGFSPGDATGLAAALETLLLRPEAVAGSPARRVVQEARALARTRERSSLAAAHVAVYRAALAGGRG